MVTTSLDVSSRQVVAKSRGPSASLTEQEVGQIGDHCSVGGRAHLLGRFFHLAEPVCARLVAPKDKVIKLEELVSETPSAVAVEDTGNQRVTETEGHSCELVDN